MAQFKIQMRWTQKGLDEIDDSLDRRDDALALIGAGHDYPMITVTNPATDIKFTVGNKKSHVEWTVQCSTNKADVRTFADEMESHGYIKCIVKG